MRCVDVGTLKIETVKISERRRLYVHITWITVKAWNLKEDIHVTRDSRYTRGCRVPANRRVYRKRVKRETYNTSVDLLSDTPREAISDRKGRGNISNHTQHFKPWENM
jgi:hypothetical protein